MSNASKVATSPSKSQGKKNEDESQSSDDEKSVTSNSMTNFSEADSRKLYDQSLSEAGLDPEEAAREECMRKLMSFRKDELVLADDSDDDDDDEEDGE